MKKPQVITPNQQKRVWRKAVCTSAALAAIGLPCVTYAATNLVVNPGFNQGANNLDGYEAFASFQKDAAAINSGWGLADAPVTADGSGTAVFSMNTQLPTADPFWVGATQAMSFQQNFWTPDNTVGVTNTTNLYGKELTFTGKALVTQAYASGNLGQAFIQFLDLNFNSVAFVNVDVSSLDAEGNFSLTANAPASGLNIIQIGFRNSGIVSTAGQMTISELSLVAVPEPGSVALVALGALLGVSRRRRSHV